MSERRFDKIDEKIDDLKQEIADLKTAVSTGFAVYNKQLEIHIVATKQNADAIKLSNAELKRLEEDVEPIKDHVKFIKKLSGLVVGLLTAAGIIFGILAYFK